MINTIEALQALFVANGGEMSEVEKISTIPEMINAIAGISSPAYSTITSAEVTTIVNTIV